MSKLLKYLKPQIVAVILAPLLMVVEVVAELYVPRIMSNIIDYGVVNNDLSYIKAQGFLALIVTIIGLLGGVGCSIFASKASQNFGAGVRKDLFKKIQSFSFVNIDKFSTSSLITRLTNDITQIQEVVLMSLKLVVRAPLLLIGSLVITLTISLKLSLILLLTMVILLTVLLLVMKFAMPLFKVVQSKIDNVNSVMRENLVGIRVVRSFVREDFEKDRFENKNKELMDYSLKAFKILAQIMPLMLLILNISLVVVVYNGGLEIDSNKLTSGDLMAFITYLTQILMSLLLVAMVLMQVSRAKASFNRINEVFEEEVSIVNNENPVKDCITKGEIEFKNVTFKYPGSDESSKPVLENINLKFSAGETIGILGGTGAGKSTLVNLILRLYEVTDGEILIDGVNIKNMDLNYLRENIGIVLQKAILFTGTIEENVRWGKKDATEEEVLTAVKSSQAFEFIEKMPDKLNSIVEQMGANFSGGQKQRLSIARTLIKKSKILILDDSTSAVDTETELKIQTAINKLMPDTTKLVIAQKISTVKNMDKIILIQNSTIQGIGTHKELLDSNKIYQEIYSSQVKEKEGNFNYD